MVFIYYLDSRILAAFENLSDCHCIMYFQLKNITKNTYKYNEINRNNISLFQLNKRYEINVVLEKPIHKKSINRIIWCQYNVL